jgi:hypothetical protein
MAPMNEPGPPPITAKRSLRPRVAMMGLSDMADLPFKKNLLH